MSGKYREYLDKSGEMYSTSGEKSYYAGYELAQKEMQEKLDAAIRSKGVACLKHDLIHYIGCGHCLDEAIEVIKMFHHDDYDERVKAYERSRDLLKARGE